MSTTPIDLKASAQNPPVIDQQLHYTGEDGCSTSLTLTTFEGAYIFAASSRQEREVRYIEYQETPAISMYFSLEGISAAYSKNSPPSSVLIDDQHVIRYTPHFEGEYVISSRTLRNFGVGLQESFFQRLMATELECLKQFRDNIHTGVLADLSPHPMPITHRQKAVISDMQHCLYTGHMRLLYYESKVIELFLLQAEQAESLLGQKLPHIKPGDIERLHAARHFVKQNMFVPISLAQIAREAGLNDFKLKKGFKELFGCTVFGYLNELKMNHARQMLLDTSCTVYEVADTLGYSEPHNFTQAFKRYFGYLPSELKG